MKPLKFSINCRTLPHLTPELFKREFLAALTTFLTMSYIVVVNPAILSTAGTGMPFEGVLTATVLLTALTTLLMGIYAGLPYAVAPGMGINAFFTYTLILQQGIPWPTALGMVFWSGVIFLLLSLTPAREYIVRGMPAPIRHATAVGIGLFLSFIGLKNAGLVVVHPETFVTFGPLGMDQILVVFGLLATVLLMKRKNPLAFLSVIALVTAAAYFTGRIPPPESWVSAPDFHSVFLKLDLWGSLQLAFLPAILLIMFTDLFDSISTFVGLSEASGLKDNNTNEPLRLREGLVVDAWATALAGVFGSSSGTAYIESAAGIEAGGRTGWTAVFIALLFLPCLFFAPVLKMVPAIATAPVLIIVGYLMFSSIRDLGKGPLEESFPAFLTALLIPLTFSITEGLLWGMSTYVLLHVLTGKWRHLSLSLYVMGALCVFMLFIQNW